MITNVNGEPYTSASEDLDLMKLRRALRERLGSEVQLSLNDTHDGQLEIDARILFQFFEIAYALGRAREGDKRRPRRAERSRLEGLIEQAMDRLGSQIWDAVQVTGGRLELSPVTELLDQAYYIGREDGAA